MEYAKIKDGSVVKYPYTQQDLATEIRTQILGILQIWRKSTLVQLHQKMVLL